MSSVANPLRRSMPVIGSLFVALVLTACQAGDGSEGLTAGVPLYEDLGDHHRAISTASEDAQAYFDQGLRLQYAFNHPEAIRS